MATSRKQRSLSTTPPDEAAFQRLIDEGLANEEDVLDAFGHAFDAWYANGGREPEVELVAVRPQVDPEEHRSLGSRLIQRRRKQHFRSSSAHQINQTETEN